MSAPVDCVPLVAFAPDQPPDAVQAVALEALQVSVELPPLATEAGLAAKLTVGAGTTETVTLREADPLEPVQESP